MNASRTFRTWSNALGWERSVRPRQEPAKELFCALSKFGRRRGQSGLKTAGDLVVIIGLQPLQRTDARETVGLGSVNPCVSMNPHFSRPPNLLRTGLISAVRPSGMENFLFRFVCLIVSGDRKTPRSVGLMIGS